MLFVITCFESFHFHAFQKRYFVRNNLSLSCAMIFSLSKNHIVISHSEKYLSVNIYDFLVKEKKNFSKSEKRKLKKTREN